MVDTARDWLTCSTSTDTLTASPRLPLGVTALTARPASCDSTALRSLTLPCSGDRNDRIAIASSVVIATSRIATAIHHQPMRRKYAAILSGPISRIVRTRAMSARISEILVTHLAHVGRLIHRCLLYTSPSPRDS